MKLVLKAGTFLLFCAAVFNEVNACTCLDYGVPTCALFSRADAVFVGKIERITSAMGDKDASRLRNRIVKQAIASVGRMQRVNDERRLLSASNKTGDRIICPDKGGILETWSSTQRIMLFNSVFKA